MYLLTRLFDSTVHPWTDLEYRSAVHGGVWLSVFHTLGTQSTMPTSDHLRVDGQADRYACPTKVGDVTVWQTVLVNTFTPDPEGLTFSPTGDRTSDLWDDAATPFQLSYCAYVQSTGYFDNKPLVNNLEWVLADGSQLPSTTRCMRRDAYTVLLDGLRHPRIPALLDCDSGLRRGGTRSSKTVLALAHHAVT